MNPYEEIEARTRLLIMDSMAKDLSPEKENKDSLREDLIAQLLAMFNWDTYHTPDNVSEEIMDAARQSLKDWWGKGTEDIADKRDRYVIEEAVLDLLVTTNQESGLAVTYKMVDWLRDTMEYTT